MGDPGDTGEPGGDAFANEAVLDTAPDGVEDSGARLPISHKSASVPEWTSEGIGVRDTPSSRIPVLPEGDDDGASPLGQRKLGRVTIDFTGPPLSMPGEAQQAPSPEDELLSSIPPADDTPASELHDGWVVDRARRTRPPEMGDDEPPPIRVPLMTPVETFAPLPGTFDTIPPSAGDALTLVDTKKPTEPDALTGVDALSEVRDRYALDDFTGALQAAELVLGADPDNAEAKRYAASCTERLEKFFVSRIGSLSAAPSVSVLDTDVRWLGLDHRAGFLLSRVAEVSSVEELLDVSGMPRLEALKTFVSLLDAEVVQIA